MLDIRTVLSPVDFSAASPAQLRVAEEICAAFGSRLVVHHNEHEAPPGISRVWDWEEQHPETHGRQPRVEDALAKVLAGIPQGIPREGRVSTGPPLGALLFLARRLPADLVVMITHGASSEEHASVTERLIADAPCPVLALHDGSEPVRPLRLADEATPPTFLVATDLTGGGDRVVSYAFDLARRVPASRLVLLHVVEGRSGAAREGAVAAAMARLELLVPSDLAGRVTCEVRSGDPVEAVAARSRDEEVALVVMGQHARGLLRNLMTRDTAQGVLHRTACPVWYVPPDH